jgi:hypothetical protein
MFLGLALASGFHEMPKVGRCNMITRGEDSSTHDVEKNACLMMTVGGAIGSTGLTIGCRDVPCQVLRTGFQILPYRVPWVWIG